MKKMLEIPGLLRNYIRQEISQEGFIRDFGLGYCMGELLQVLRGKNHGLLNIIRKIAIKQKLKTSLNLLIIQRKMGFWHLIC